MSVLLATQHAASLHETPVDRALFPWLFAKHNSLRLFWRMHSLPSVMHPNKAIEGIRMSREITPSPSIIEKHILLIRDQKVMLDENLAELYGVETKTLKRAVRRNRDRFPDDFMFVLTIDEYSSLRRQFGTIKRGQHSKYLPYAFTEQGIAMLSGVLHSKQAVKVNIAIMRAFVRLREIFSAHKDLARKLEDLERRYETHDKQIHAVFEAIRQLMAPEQKPKRRIGFEVKGRSASGLPTPGRFKKTDPPPAI
jgi:phage regulator Rha-like protein